MTRWFKSDGSKLVCAFCLLATFVACSSADLCEPGQTDCARAGYVKLQETGSGGDEGNSSGGVPGTGGSESDETFQDRYLSALALDCEDLCSWLDACGRTVFTDPSRTCEESCVRQATAEVRYFDCEPVYRRFLACVPSAADCDLGVCTDFSDDYLECLDPPLPANANSCVLANNGACDEPEGCVTGSDTNDCAPP